MTDETDERQRIVRCLTCGTHLADGRGFVDSNGLEPV